jgi:predicted ATPase
MINSVLFKKDFRSFNKGDKFDFFPGINVLVGDQGTGKSTLIELIRSKLEPKKTRDSDSTWRAKSIVSSSNVDDIIDISHNSKCSCLAFDFDRESPRDMSMLHNDMIDEQLIAMKSSHGQGNIIALSRILKKAKENKDTLSIILFDEPDMAMSPRNCYEILKILLALRERWNMQVIISAHNPILINGKHPLIKENIYDRVLSLEDKKWMSATEFLTRQILPLMDDKNDKKEKKKA